MSELVELVHEVEGVKSRLYFCECGDARYKIVADNMGGAWLAVMKHLGATMPHELPEPRAMVLIAGIHANISVEDEDTKPFDCRVIARAMHKLGG